MGPSPDRIELGPDDRPAAERESEKADLAPSELIEVVGRLRASGYSRREISWTLGISEEDVLVATTIWRTQGAIGDANETDPTRRKG